LQNNEIPFSKKTFEMIQMKQLITENIIFAHLQTISDFSDYEK